MALIKKENICIHDVYTDSQGNEKKLWKTIGEIVTIQGSSGPFQKVKLWGPGGFVEASVLEPKDDNSQQAPPQGYQQPQQHYAPQPQQQGYQQPTQGGYRR